MNSDQKYVTAVRELLEGEENRHALSVALVAAATLSKSHPDVFNEEPILEGVSEETDRAMKIVVGGLTALVHQGILPSEDATAGMLATLQDPQLRMILLGTTLELMDAIDKDPELVAELEEAGDDAEAAAEAVKDSELGDTK